MYFPVSIQIWYKNANLVASACYKDSHSSLSSIEVKKQSKYYDIIKVNIIYLAFRTEKQNMRTNMRSIINFERTGCDLEIFYSSILHP